MTRGSTTNARIRVTSDTRPARRAMNNFRKSSAFNAKSILGDWRSIAGGIIGAQTATQFATRAINDYNVSTRNLVAGTGAYGERLAGLRSAVTDIGSAVPLSVDAVSRLTADLDTAFAGLAESDPMLFRQVAIGLADIENAVGEGAGSKLLSVARGFEIATDQLRGFADVFLGLDQSTSGDTNRFLRDIERYTPILEEYTDSGFEVLNMVSGLTNANVRLTNIQTGLSRITGTAVEQNRSSRAVLREVVTAIQEATTAEEKRNIAVEHFSETAGPGFVDAIEAGAFALRDQQSLLEEYEGTVQRTGETMSSVFDLATQSLNAFTGALNEDLGRLNEAAQGRGFSLDDVAAGIGGFIYGATKGSVQSAGPLAPLGGLAQGIRRGSAGFNRSRDLREGNVTNIYNGPVIGADAGEQIEQTRIVERERSGYNP